jgi:hypothetical protein
MGGSGKSKVRDLWERRNNIKMVIKNVMDDVDLIHLMQYRSHHLALVNTVINLPVL